MPVLVNGEAVDEDLILKEERALRPQLLKAMPDEPHAAIDKRAREWARDNIVDQVLLRQAVAADPEAVARVTSKLARPKSKDVTEYYKKHRAALYAPEMVNAAHILVKVDGDTDEATALERIREIERRIAEGAEFQSLEGVEQLGFFPRGRMVPEFEAMVFAMRPGQVSGVFRTAFGFHIARVLSRRADGIPELNDVRGEIETVLMREKQRRAIERYVDQLRTTADIRLE